MSTFHPGPLGGIPPTPTDSYSEMQLQRRKPWSVCRASVLLVTLIGLLGCQNRSNDDAVEIVDPNPSATIEPAITWQDLATLPAESSSTLFQRLEPSQTNVDFAVPIDKSHPLKRLYVGGFICGGVAVGDVDGDELPDMYLVSGPERNGLYRNSGGFRFEDITERAGVGGGEAWGVAAAMVDIDNDGDLDIYVCNYDSPNLLYINNGDATFAESAARFGLDIVDSCLLPAFCDYDCDGDLDCYILTNRYYREGGLPTDLKLIANGGRLSLPEQYGKYYGLRTTGRNRGQLQMIGRPDRLLRNEGDGTFSDVTQQAGISSAPGHGLSATWWDFDQDGHCDLYVGNDFNDPDHLYHNNGNGTFTDVIEQRVPHTSWFSMGADFGDINNDGLMDFLIADMSATTHFGEKTTMGAMGKHTRFLETASPRQYMRNALYLNTGTDRFMEIAYLSGLASSDWTWAVKLADLDNDGLLDAFFTNGMTRNLNDSDLPFSVGDQLGGTKWDLYENLPTMPQQNLAFRNKGQLQFADASRSWGLDHVGMSFACASADLDRDGDLDLVVANLEEPVSIYRNQSADGHRMTLRLRGSRSNQFGIGATVRIETSRAKQIRQIITTTGYLASNEPILHFGLGGDQRIEKLSVDWPSGCRQTFENLPADRMYTVREPNTESSRRENFPDTTALFRRSQALAGVRHRELPFDDYQRQPLLPFRFSQLGPGLACGDVNGDGRDDVFVGGAAGQAGMLYVNRGEGSFTEGGQYPFSQDALCEDMAPLLLDVDGDGDQDLYVVSGGVECDPGDESLRDRLYVNDGRGNFVRAPADYLPDVRDSGSVATACDFDRDGDLDLFVGGRIIPGQYPLAANSRLLRNEGGRFTDVTMEVASPLTQTGLVTGAIWSDVNRDGWLDLLVTHEWGPVKLFRNLQGRLVDQTDQAGLSQLLGWWNGIAGRDLDGDGDVDYVVANVGLNTKYHASIEKPALLYYGDFERNGRMKLVEAEYEADVLYPLRGRSCSSHAMPFLTDKFTTYKSFAAASLQDIYTPTCLDEAHRFIATTLQSGVLLNDGAGRFNFKPLPQLAQASPVFGIVLTEIDGDGFPDAYLAQNFFGPQVETGRFDGGLSVLLKGNGDGTYSPIWPRQSGLIVPGDAKSLTTIDLNGNGRSDFVIGVNDSELVAFERTDETADNVIAVTLNGPPGNLTAVGARVSLHVPSEPTQTAEVYAGSGYLSQSSPTLYFGRGSSSGDLTIEISWPDGSRSTHQASARQKRIVVGYRRPATAFVP